MRELGGGDGGKLEARIEKPVVVAREPKTSKFRGEFLKRQAWIESRRSSTRPGRVSEASSTLPRARTFPTGKAGTIRLERAD